MIEPVAVRDEPRSRPLWHARAGFSCVFLALSLHSAAVRSQVEPSTAATLSAVCGATAVDSIRALVRDGRDLEAMRRCERLLAARARSGDDLTTVHVLDIWVGARCAVGRAADRATLARAQRALALRESLTAGDAPTSAISLQNLSTVTHAHAHAAAGIHHYQGLIAKRTASLGPNSRDVTSIQTALAALQADTGDLDAALATYGDILAAQGRTSPLPTTEVARTRLRMGVLQARRGVHAKARQEIAQGLDVLAAATEPRRFALLLQNLAAELVRDGNMQHAIPLYVRSVSVWASELGPEHPYTSRCAGDLARTLRDAGEWALAGRQFGRILDMPATRAGWDRLELAALQRDYGSVLESLGEPRAARQQLAASLEILRKCLGERDPNLARMLRDTADSLSPDGDLHVVLDLYRRALGPPAPGSHDKDTDLPRALLRLAEDQAQQGKCDAALEAAITAAEIRREAIVLAARTLSERRAAELAPPLREVADFALSIAVTSPESPTLGRVFEMIAGGRALVLDEMIKRRRTIGAARSEIIDRLTRDFTDANAAFADVNVSAESRDGRRSAAAARSRREDAEAALAGYSVVFRLDIADAPVALPDVVASLPPRSSLVSFVRYVHTPIESMQGREVRGSPTGTAPAYAAMVLQAGNEQVRIVNLGRAHALEMCVSRWLREASHLPAGDPVSATSRARHVGTELRRLLWDPIAPLVAGADRVFVVADAALHEVNLASLPTEVDRYLVESGPTLHSLSAERDLVQASRPVTLGRGLLAMGGADFDGSDPWIDAAKSETGSSTGAAFRGTVPHCAEFAAFEFEPLPKSAAEVDEIAAIWRSSPHHEGGADAVRLTGPNATEPAFKRLAPGREIMHVATHGFVLMDSCTAAVPGTRGLGQLAASRAEETQMWLENPLRLAGLALAGANRRESAGPGRDDGILTCEEIAALDLTGARWAVLSACESGRGEIAVGEGVLGLRRAFQLAGARTLIMSLWGVEDEAARQWMRALYDARFGAGLDTAESVRRASRAVLDRRRAEGRSSHPFYWAGFVASGDWR